MTRLAQDLELDRSEDGGVTRRAERPGTIPREDGRGWEPSQCLVYQVAAGHQMVDICSTPGDGRPRQIRPAVRAVRRGGQRGGTDAAPGCSLQWFVEYLTVRAVACCTAATAARSLLIGDATAVDAGGLHREITLSASSLPVEADRASHAFRRDVAGLVHTIGAPVAIVEQKRTPEVVKQHVAHVREELWYLIDELWDWESQLPYPPEPVCPCCRREMPPTR